MISVRRWPVTGFAGAEHAQGKAPAVLEGFDGGGDFQDRIAHGGQAVILVGLREQFRFHDAGLVGEGEKFHRLAGDLVMRALFDHQPAGRDGFAEVFAQAGNGAIRIPGDVVE